MKRLADYTGDEAIELWADIMQPLAVILADPNVAALGKKGNPPLLYAKEILKTHKKEASEILLRVDDRPLNALNLITRLLSLLNEIMTDEDAQSFFLSQGQKTQEEYSGSATENTEGAEQ